jgi:hypothetical protein
LSVRTIQIMYTYCVWSLPNWKCRNMRILFKHFSVMELHNFWYRNCWSGEKPCLLAEMD